jgi:predicted nucleic acid-binding protein
MTASFDSNVVIYLVTGNTAKAAASRTLLSTPGVVSVQVFNEVISVLRSSKRGRTAVAWVTIDNVLAFLRTHHRVVPIDLATHARARAYAERYKLKIYDAGIIAAASLAGCTTLFSEDMSDGQVIDGVTIRNPYAGLAP